MTNEEAIYYLKSSGMSDEQIKSVIDAFTCKDCIRREEALLALTGMDLPTDIDKLIALFTKRVQQLPSVTPQQTSWIPVSERMPLCEQEVLICTQRRTISGKTKSIITSAIYEDGNMRECYSRWHWEDIEYESWDEEEDCGIIPEGWWEYRHYNPDEVYNNLVDDFILAWMPLPQPYTESEE